MRCCTGTGFLGVRPRTGISRGNLAAFYMCSAFSVCSFVVMAAAQPNLLRILLADDGEREGGRRSGGVEDGTANIGSVTGNFVLVAELTILTCSGPWGVVSDIYGRRFVWSVGLMIMAIAFCLAPMAPSIPTLMLVRALHSVGASGAASMLTPVLAEYVLEVDKGKGAGILGLSAALGAVFGALFLLRVPSWAESYLPPPESASAPNMAISVGYYVTAFVMALASLFAFLTLNPETPPHPPAANVWVRGGAVLKNSAAWARDYALQVWDVLQDGVLVLALAASFAGRGDASAITSLLPVWIIEYMREVKGATAAEAASRAGMVTGFIQLAALFLSYPVGFLSDSIGDVAAVLLAGVSAGLAYMALATLSDPTGSSALMLAVPLGLAEISVAITSQVIISRRGQPSKRGLLGAMFSVTSAMGILFIGKVGGLVYDLEGPGAPFFVVAAMNFSVATGAALVWWCKGENRLVKGGEEEGEGAALRLKGAAGWEESDAEALAHPSHAL